ncbi:histone h3 lysine 36 methyltransferase [Ophiostoma piceae UAMH 11346]|uniref:Histone-lysine N-methyltransferase, H3 lysine-36 specific n=1 Tax=Ophiostoma piceae (strain UAMH 11346) TaxID=1262450 RepID=S3C9Y4_OPHP1|nr:histone h3 lysine 36 methyltransferase [Ophiostoma piceae UAMH 11346]
MCNGHNGQSTLLEESEADQATPQQMDHGARTPRATDGAKKMTATPSAAANGSRPNGLRVAVKKEAVTTSAANTPNGSKDGTASRSLSPDDIKPSPSDSITTPDTNAAAPKLNRKVSSLQKTSGSNTPARGNRVTYDHLPDATEEATSQFQVITDCLYGSKRMGSSDNDALDCDCAEELRNGQNLACGEDSDCINRATKMECMDSECRCGEGCQNQRFQRKEYARVSVIKTEKKGFGLRTDADLLPNDFIYEYIGEVINEPAFRRRTVQYDEEGIKHFYFMSLTKSEFVDATRKGNLGRFCNHSCNPNCYVDKWVVGDKLRMGIFASRHIRAGEELVFDYNVDRYGADPQPCYCGEPNCTGFIGGKTQTERATKLSVATIEALGIDDPDSWDTTVSKKQRRKKPNEEDEEYVNSLEQTGLAEDGVTKVMAALMQCKEKWIAVKLLKRIQSARDDERVLNRVVHMHGYQILRSILTAFQDDNNVVLQALDILYRFPRVTKNKISDSSIEKVVEPLVSSEHEDVAAQSKRLLEEWGKLEIAYRIPRKKIDPNAPATSFENRRGRDTPYATANAGTDETANNSVRQRGPLSPLSGMVVPKGPKSNIPQRNNSFANANANGGGIIGGNGSMLRNQRKQKVNQNVSLPFGWFAANDPNGNVYYYTKSGATTWKRPTQPAEKVVPALKVPSKAQQDMDAVQDIINNLTKPVPRPSVTNTPQPAAHDPAPKPSKPAWQTFSVEKQHKIYANTIHPSIKSVIDRFGNRLPKPEIKKLGKEISKSIVSSDYKHNRVQDPFAITSKQEKKIKDHVRKFLEHAVEKYQKLAKDKSGRRAQHGAGTTTSSSTPAKGITGDSEKVEASGASATADTDQGNGADDTTLGSLHLTDDEDDEVAATGQSPDSSERKRKRADSAQGAPSTSVTPSETPSIKRLKDEDAAGASTPPTPPPPPPPPAQEEEEPEAVALRKKHDEDEQALIRENEEAMRDFEEQSKPRQPTIGQIAGSTSSNDKPSTEAH